MEGKFVITKSNLVADLLKKFGYSLVSNKEGVWTFLNDGKHMLSEQDKKEIVFSNKIFI